MSVRKARPTDFAHLETFVWQAIFPAFDRDGLSDPQRAENDALVANARTEVFSALDRDHYAVFVATDLRRHSLVGYVIVDARPRAYAEIVRLIVRRANWGKGVANELMTAATEFIGRDRAVSLAVRHYNERALAFFAKHDFIDTGETTGDHAIPRTLLLREAYEEVIPPTPEPVEETFDFPSAADEPVFAPLPDFNLTVDEAPLFETGQNALATEDLRELPPEESSLSEEQISELEAFIARAKAKKKENAPSPKYDPSKIEFEIDYGDAPEPIPVVPPTPKQPGTTTVASSFEFAFEPTAVATPSPAETKSCPACQTKLPIAARFCFHCGHPQSDPSGEVAGEQAPEDEVLILEELPPTPEPEPTAARKRKSAPVALAELKTAFREYLQDRLTAYFGSKQTTKYLQCLEAAADFQQVRDGSLGTLVNRLNQREKDDAVSRAAAHTRRDNTLADLTEYFIVETCADLHGGIFPQRLLRHQSVDWEKADLFRLVMDYLDFDAESEVVYTDFVVMPTRALRNATKSFLQAARDERVFFICDQSLISQAKNGFAITDAGIYWKNVLQPAGSATFTTMNAPRLEQGHLVIDNQFFDAGGRLNLKIAILLDKLRRMQWTRPSGPKWMTEKLRVALCVLRVTLWAPKGAAEGSITLLPSPEGPPRLCLPF
ncbi:MAG: GNAT family N-acetyltransferase [Bacteroidota bacterium]